MRKEMIALVSMAVLVCSCGSAGEGAYVGGQFGHVIGSAIGGLSGGWRGHEVGSIVGTVGGIAAGAAIGTAVENARVRKYEEQAARRQTTSQRSNRNVYAPSNDSGYDPMGRGDDRITFTHEPVSPLQIRHAQILESVRDGVLTRGEECTVMFEIYNTGDATVFDVCPMVEDVTGNKHVKISPNLRIESIPARQGVRYTATVLADSRLKDGEILVRVGVAQGGSVVGSETRQFSVPTSRRATAGR